MYKNLCVLIGILLTLVLVQPAAAHRSLRDRNAQHIIGAVGHLGASLAIDPDFDNVTSGTPLLCGGGLIYMPSPMIETRLEFVGRRASSSDGDHAGLIDVYGGSASLGYVLEPWVMKIDLAFAVSFVESRLHVRDELIDYERKSFSTGFSPRVGAAFEIDAGPLLICPGLLLSYDHIPTEDFYVLKQLGGVSLALQLQVLMPIKQQRRSDDEPR
ncbi:MAG: hypothetical protein P9M14_14380 [Candidatus Alcyoniella australis]|nr:hypothetical protein [Candidatus Alcyoniella australis]